MADDLCDEWWNDASDTANHDASPRPTPSDHESDSNDDKHSAVAGSHGPLKAKPVETESRKRKSTGGDDEGDKKKKKRSKRKKISEAISKAAPEPAKYTDLTSALVSHYKAKLSPVEMDELQVTEERFVPCGGVSDAPSDYLHTVLTVPKWKKKVKIMDKSPGSPLLLVVCSAATRAVDVIRDLKKFHGTECKVAKLFAKHIKLPEQTKFLQKSVVHVGVGTPNRIMALLQNDSLRLSQTMLVMLDWSWRDAKLRRLIDIPEIRDDLFTLLQKYLVPRVKTSSTKFAIL